VFTILVNRARTRGAREARVVPWSSLAPDEDEGPTVDPSRFQGPDGRYPGGWTPEGAPRPWGSSPEERALAGEAIALLNQALERLPPRQRAVVTLRDLQELDADEICEVLNLTPANQRVLLHRGRAALRASLEAYYRG
jgi:RNA polymerase sigma-70 factor (ECF subfamily)